MITPGFTFLSPSPEYETMHLFIVVFTATNGKALLANVTTIKSDNDHTCILKKGDHPFIKRDSIMNYGDAFDTEITKIEEAIAMNLFKPREPASANLLKRIQEGAKATTALKPGLKKYLPI